MCHITEAFRPKTAANPLSLDASVYSLIVEEEFLIEQHTLAIKGEQEKLPGT